MEVQQKSYLHFISCLFLLNCHFNGNLVILYHAIKNQTVEEILYRYNPWWEKEVSVLEGALNGKGCFLNVLVWGLGSAIQV